jgi:hypothetical protein
VPGPVWPGRICHRFVEPTHLVPQLPHTQGVSWRRSAHVAWRRLAAERRWRLGCMPLTPEIDGGRGRSARLPGALPRSSALWGVCPCNSNCAFHLAEAKPSQVFKAAPSPALRPTRKGPQALTSPLCVCPRAPSQTHYRGLQARGLEGQVAAPAPGDPSARAVTASKYAPSKYAPSSVESDRAPSLA